MFMIVEFTLMYLLFLFCYLLYYYTHKISRTLTCIVNNCELISIKDFQYHHMQEKCI